jgi:putative ABC transport system substrate-binding protein
MGGKKATSTIPILFHSASDPVANGFIASLARPGGNLTGVSLLSVDLIPKRLELILELVPQARVIAMLARPGLENNEAVIGEMQETMRARQVDLRVLKIRAESEVDSAFKTLVQLKASGVVTDGAYRRQIAPLALRHGVPSIAPQRDFTVVDGGLLSYGHSNTAIYRLKGIYTGKILNGAKASELPVQQPTKLELVINLKTAKALGLTVPPSILARADEVIE